MSVDSYRIVKKNTNLLIHSWLVQLRSSSSRCLHHDQIRINARHHKRGSNIPNRLVNISAHRRATIFRLERAKLRMVVLHCQATRTPHDDHDDSGGMLLLLLLH